MTGIVTPEAVRLEFPDAGIGSRGVALLIDACVLLVALIAISLGAGAALDLASVSGGLTVATLLILNFVILFGYPIVGEVAFGGRTLGKLALGLRVVTREGAPVRFRHAAIRSAFMLVDFMLTFGAGAVLTAAFTRRSQRLGDLVAGTVVLRERHAAGVPRAHTFSLPPGTQAYAATITPNVLDAAGYERIRAFLLRASELTDEARHSIAVSLARPLLASTPPPPAGMDPVTYLAVIMSVYQSRWQSDAAALGHSGADATGPAAVGDQPAAASVAGHRRRPDDGGFSAPG